MWRSFFLSPSPPVRKVVPTILLTQTLKMLGSQGAYDHAQLHREAWDLHCRADHRPDSARGLSLGETGDWSWGRPCSLVTILRGGTREVEARAS